MNPSVLTLLRSLLLDSVFTRLLLALILVVTNPVSAAEASAFWLDDSHFDPSSELNDLLQVDPAQLTARMGALPLTGGTFWHLMSAEVVADEPLVIDFQSSSVVGLFSHFVIDAQGERIATYRGGIKSTELNRYFLRHGRALAVAPGHYRIYTRMTSPFLVAQLAPNIFAEGPYLESIKLGNTLTLMGLGILLALGFYYLTLGFVRNQSADFLYSVFIFGYLIYNATALNVFSDIFGWTIFYSIGLPIMVSSMAYIGFVMRLLGINKKHTPGLHKTGLIALATLASFWLVVPFFPHHSLEFARYGVAIFALYGLSAAVILTRRGNKTARYYLIVSIAFIIPASVTILLQSLPQNTLLIEHLGLLAVAIEVMLLSLVLGHQLNILYREKSASLFAAREALFAADQAIRTKERFLANISHELRTPLNAIQGSVELLNQEIDTPESLESLTIIDQASASLLFLINDILDIAKLNDNKLVIDNRAINVKTMASHIGLIYGSGLTGKVDTQFELKIAPDLPEWIMGDEQRIEQVVANLLSNAFKFAPNGTVRLELSMQDQGRLLQISVIDDGIGIDPKNIRDMFGAFTQADSSISRRYGGTGLGLTIVGNLVKLMGGKIEAESKLGQGSHFWFSLPLIVAPVRSNEASHPLSVKPPDFNGLHIVIVDDNAVNLKVACGLLKRLNVNITAFDRAPAALVHIAQQTTDLVIMDVQMPEMDGLTATHILRERGFTHPIIAFTANSSEQDRQDCLTAGANDILVKPIKQQQLIDMLVKWSVAPQQPEGNN